MDRSTPWDFDWRDYRPDDGFLWRYLLNDVDDQTKRRSMQLHLTDEQKQRGIALDDDWKFNNLLDEAAMFTSHRYPDESSAEYRAAYRAVVDIRLSDAEHDAAEEADED
jgi:hypothetical protein